MKHSAVIGRGMVAALLLALACAALVRASSASADVVLPEPAVSVTWAGKGWTALTQPDGKVLIAGTFTEVNGGHRLHVARFTADAVLDTGFSVDTNLPVSSLAVAGDHLYLGGMFGTVGGKPRGYLARVSLATGALDDWSMDANGMVHTLLLDGFNLYVGGSFTTLGGAAHGGLARITVGNGQRDPDFRPAFGGGHVTALAVSGNQLYAGGTFSAVDGHPRAHIARLGVATGALDMGWAPTLDGEVAAIAADGAAVYVGGDFTVVGGLGARGLVKISATSGAPDPVFAPRLNYRAASVAIVGGELRIAGGFSSIAGRSTGPVARLDLATGAPKASGETGWSGSIEALAQSGNRLFAVGTFTIAAGYDASGLVLLDPLTLAVDNTRTFSITYPGEVAAMVTLPDSTILIGGYFERVNGKPHANLAQLNADGTLNPGWTNGTDGMVYALAVGGGYAYIGGYFGLVDGAPVSHLARINLLSRQVDRDFRPQPNGFVYDLAFNGGALYVGGQFTTIGGAPIANAARMDPVTGAVDTGWTPNPDGHVNVLLPQGPDMLVGGHYTSIGGLERKSLARIFGATGRANPAFDADLSAGAGVPYVNALALSGSSLFVGGAFYTVRGLQKAHMAKVDADFGVPLSGFTAGLNTTVLSLLATGNAVYAGGAFTSVQGAAHRGVARLDPVSGALDTTFGEVGLSFWSPMVRTLMATGDRIWIGGQFETFAGLPRNQIAAWGPLVPRVITVYEFFAPTLNHYFRTANAEEAAALIANPALGFDPTGNDFHAYSRAAYPADAKPVYRFYGSMTPGPNSHFYTADPDEYAALRALQFAQPSTLPRWNFEEIAFAIALPVALNTCPGTAPVKVYRAYNNRALQGDSNHRYTTDLLAYNQMLAQGWLGESVVMCALP